MELALDIFRTDDFAATTMTDMVGDIDQVPTVLEDRGYFTKRPIRTTTVTFVKKDRTLELVPTSERGTPEPLTGRQLRDTVQIDTPRTALRERVSSAEVKDLLNPALPFDIRLDNANALVAERQLDMVDRIRLTNEYHRFGALQGKVMDADGVRVVSNIYDEMGIPEPAQIALDIANTPEGQLREKIETLIVMPMRQALKGRITTGTRIHAFCGIDFKNAILRHPDYRKTLEVAGRVEQLHESTIFQTFSFAGVTWEHWDDLFHDELSIAPDEARLFPVGAADMFFEFIAPGEDWEDMGALGRELYSIVSPDNRTNMNEWVDIYVRTYRLPFAKAPQALMSARAGA
jgi:hypothetical protein